jgi:hypothetical protein
MADNTPEKRKNSSGRVAGGLVGLLANALGCRLFAVLGLIIVVIIVFGMAVTGNFLVNLTAIFNRPPTFSAVVVLERIQAMSQLTTVRYNYSGLVTSERDMPGIIKTLYGEKMVLNAVGAINAGIDLSQVKAENVIAKDGVLTIQLPSPHLQDCILDEGKSYVVSRDTGIFARTAPNMDADSRRYAILQFRQSAIDGGILTEAQTQAQKVLSEFLSALRLEGINKVQVVNAPIDPNAPLPETCK